MKSFLHQFWDRFNLAFNQVEISTDKTENSYLGLSYEALYTSKEDLELIFNDKNVTGTFLDLGCGQGQTVLYYAIKFPDRKALGIEFQKSRFDFSVSIQDEFEIKNVHLIMDNLLSCKIPKADTYFLYFPSGYILDRVLTELYEGNNAFHLIVIESHGDLIPRIEKENWLELVQEIKLSSKRHYPKAKIYKRLFCDRDPNLRPHFFSFQKRFLIIHDNEITWIGESFQMEWVGGDQFNLKNPPRTICWRDVKKMMCFDDFDSLTKFVVSLRNLGELSFLVEGFTIQASIRKIIMEPTFMIELSTGQRLQWEEISSISRGLELCYDSSYVV